MSTPTKFTDQEKRNIVATYVMSGGDVDAVLGSHRIKRQTFNSWKRKPWFNEMVADMQDQHGQRIRARTERALDRALSELEDRVELGDVVSERVTKTVDGVKHTEYVNHRVPVKARDLSAIVNVLATRSEKAQAMTAAASNTHQLADLQSAFREFAKDYKKEQEDSRITLEGEYNHIEGTYRADQLVTHANNTANGHDVTNPKDKGNGIDTVHTHDDVG